MVRDLGLVALDFVFDAPPPPHVIRVLIYLITLLQI
jgi:hypothetical protein